MSKDWAGDYYEEKFEFPLWKLIKERAEEKDISYLKAIEEVAPEFAKDVRIRDKAFEERKYKIIPGEIENLYTFWVYQDDIFALSIDRTMKGLLKILPV